MKTVPIPLDRIKTITASVRIDKYASCDQEFYDQYLLNEIARGIASKLIEFGKVKKEDFADFTLSHISFDVIVPLGPPK